MFKLFSSDKKLLFKQGNMGFVVAVVLILSLPCLVHGAFRYNLDSCSDLVPKHTPDHPENYETHQPGWHSANNNLYGSDTRLRKIRSDSYGNESPFRITVPGQRYRRNSDLEVLIEGKGYFDGVMVQGRALHPGGETIPGGVGLVGRFDHNKFDKRNFSYLECYRQPYATLVDNGYSRLGNVTFVWQAPDADIGSVRFLAGITKGIHYWIIVSNILHFNPFPISTVQCGGAEACFRVCPLDSSDGLCTSYDAVLMYSYNTEFFGKRDVEFTLGGKLSPNQYIAVVYAEDNDNLFQADVTACYMEQGRAQLAHLLLEVTGAPLLQVAEEISLSDYDYDGTSLWCRFRRPISHSQSSIINPWRSFYTLLYKADLNLISYPKFQTPSRSSMYSSDMKLNLTTPINKIYSGSPRIADFSFGININVAISILCFLAADQLRCAYSMSY